MTTTSERFHFTFSHELQDRIQIKITSVDGDRQQQQQTPINDIFYSNNSSFVRNLTDSKRSEPYVLCQIFSDGQALCLPVQTSFKSFSDKWSWNEWITLPLRYCDLPRYAILALSIHEIISPTEVRIVGSTTIALFDIDGTFRKGIYHLKIWPSIPPDVKYDSSTPGEIESIKSNEQILNNQIPSPPPPPSTSSSTTPSTTLPVISTANLQYNYKQITTKPLNITWNDDSAYPMLDELSRIAKLIRTQCDGHTISQDWLDQLTLAKTRTSLNKERSTSKSMLLIIEFAQIMIENNECIVLYFEPNCEDVLNYPVGIIDPIIYDPELDLENIVENKHLKLSRSTRKTLDKELKPTSDHRIKLEQILAYPPAYALLTEEQDFIWKYRFYLSQREKALTKFLQCVHWKNEEEVKQALDLLSQWVTVNTEDALELLGPTHEHPKVRAYAVSRLRQTSDDDLLLYLLQLVQALRYENYDSNSIEQIESFTGDEQNIGINDDYEGSASAIEQSVLSNNDTNKSSSTPDINLSTFLIQRACENYTVANYLFWYACVERENNSSIKDASTKEMYETFLKKLSRTWKEKNDETRKIRSAIEKQKLFVDKLVELTEHVHRLPGGAKAKEEKMKAYILAGDESPVKFNFLKFDAITLPLDPKVEVCGILPDKLRIFKSAKLPFLLVFKTTNNTEYPIIFKNGDDLRQDQLILQIITLMDRILKKEYMDLKLTPYKVLATGLRHGFVEYIENQTLGAVRKSDRSLKQYLQSKSTGPKVNDIGIAEDVMNAYVKSCAGYCVITYLLGIGDRHPDNLLIRDSGQLFHIDFGFILGRDPKPLPPAMRVSNDMFDMLTSSQRFHDFLRYCFTSFIMLRKHANVFANLLSLMLDANIPDIALERDKAVKKLLEKFRLDLDDVKAETYLKNLIDSSIGAILPELSDHFHNLVLMFR